MRVRKKKRLNTTGLGDQRKKGWMGGLVACKLEFMNVKMGALKRIERR
jgi:hypothetical protein